MRKKLFYIFLLIITLFGFYLRTLDYVRIPPFGETRDEFMYPWAGMSLIRTGIPTSWADFYSYTQKTPVKYWGVNFNLVSPWNEKPPLYPILVGGWALINGETQFNEVRLSIIRQVPIFLNIFSIILLGLLAKEVFGKKVGILSAILYATIPTMVMANRLSLIENLLIPLSLFTLWSLYKFKGKPVMPYLVGLGCGLTLFTKNTGLALPGAILLIFFMHKQWKNLVITGLITGIFALIHPLMGIYYGWNLYISLINEYRQYMLVGFPETIASIFRYPVIGHKEAIFLDGGMLAGWILLLTTPFWYFNNRTIQQSNNIFIYPLLFVLQMCFVVGGQTWFGWHWFPVYPFLTIILAYTLIELFNQPQIFKLIFFYLILAASSLRFIMLINGNNNLDWSKTLGVVFVILLGLWQIPFVKTKKILLISLLAIYIAINIYTVINLKLIYPSLPQPLN